MRFSIVLSAILMLFIGKAQSQISHGGYPSTLGKEAGAASRQRTFLSSEVRIKNIDNEVERARAEKVKADCDQCKQEFFGTGIDVSVDIKRQGKKYDVDSGFIWLTTIKSETAMGMQFFFDKFFLPPGSRLYFYNDSASMVLGAFTEENNHSDKRFATQLITGRNITIEYFEPKKASIEGELHLYKVIHAFKEMYASHRYNYFGQSGDCNIDVNCPEGNDYQDVKKGVCRILFYDDDLNLSSHCSGSLVNTTSAIRSYMVLTAEHCVTNLYPEEYPRDNPKKYRISEWIFEFGYEAVNCTNPQDPFVNTKTIQGGSLISRGKLSDYALIEMSTSSIPDSYDVIYLGWDARYNSISTKAVGIHHPSGDVKKISVDNNPPSLAYTEKLPPPFDHKFAEMPGAPLNNWKVTWEKGVTEGGSSGSPLFNDNKLIIGQLRGGYSTCADRPDPGDPAAAGPDYYGRLGLSWNNPDPDYSASPLKRWLDYGNKGVLVLNSYNPRLPKCSNGVRDADESAIDCGGSCPPCNTESPQNCYNGFQDNGETDVDCGGPCLACPDGDCNNGIKDGDETGVDCGGMNCQPCTISSLTPSYVLGDFNYAGLGCFGDCKLLGAECETNGWEPHFGTPLLGSGGESGNHHLALTGRDYEQGQSELNYSYSSCAHCYASSSIYRNFFFEKDHTYIMSFKALTGETYGYETGPRFFQTIDRFTIRLVNGNQPRSGCGGAAYYTPKYYHNTPPPGNWQLPNQVIFHLVDYKNDLNEGNGWETFYFEFTPREDWTQIQLILWPASPHDQPSLAHKYRNGIEILRLDDIFLYEPEDFFNPCCKATRTISPSADFSGDVAANELVRTPTIGTLSILSGKSAKFSADQVHLRPGFHAKKGSTFHAVDGYCELSKSDGINHIWNPLENCTLPENRSIPEMLDPNWGEFFLENSDEYIGQVEKLLIYPNPTEKFATVKISFESIKQAVSFSLISPVGVRLLEENSFEKEFFARDIDVSMFPRGIYLIKVVADGKTYTQKLSVE